MIFFLYFVAFCLRRLHNQFSVFCLRFYSFFVTLLAHFCLLSVYFVVLSLPVMFFLLLMYHHIGKLCLSSRKNCLISWDTGVHLEADQSFPTRWWTWVTRSPEQAVYVWIQMRKFTRSVEAFFFYERATLSYLLLPWTKFETMSLREKV